MTDVLITPASGKIEFKDSSNNVDAKIELDANGNLNITSPGGDINIGDTTTDIYIGDGINNVDIVFEQNGEIRGTTGVTLTLGQADSFVSMATNLNLASNNITNGGTITATSFVGTLTGTASNANLLDSLDSSQFLRSDASDIATTVQFSGGVTYTPPAGAGTDTATDVGVALTSGTRIVGGADGYIRTLLEWNSGGDIEIGQGGTSLITGINLLPGINGPAKVNGNRILTVADEGAGNGLDADTLDGQQGSYYTGYTDTAIANLIDTAPTTLNTLNELAAALGDDPNFATTVTNSIAAKVSKAGDTMTGDLVFNDNVKATFGTGGDLDIYHTGTTSYIEDTGTGDIAILSNGPNGVLIGKGPQASYEPIIRALPDAGVELYYNNSKKFETLNTGATVSGNFSATNLTTTGTTQTGSLNVTNGVIQINGNAGTSGQVLTSNGTSAYWSTQVGYTGSQGPIGYTGSQGIQGPIGYTGSQGIQGPIGYTGSKGDQGVTGFTGSQGIQGPIGFTGSQGIQGPIGYTGSKGDIGYTGSRGNAGVNGTGGGFFVIEGERSGSVSTNSFYAFGNGASSPNGERIPIDCNLEYLTLVADGISTLSVELYVNGSGTGQIVSLSAETSAQVGSLSYSILAGDAVQFRCVSGSSSFTTIVSAWFAHDGVKGYTGSQGIQGTTGFTGSQGIQGPIGYTGSAGIPDNELTVIYAIALG